MSGRLVLASPWCREAIPPAERPAIEARIRDGYTVALTSLSSRQGYRTDIAYTAGPRAESLIDRWEWPPKLHAMDAIDRAVKWIDEYDAAIFAGVEVPVR